jgi:hypothetical protein
VKVRSAPRDPLVLLDLKEWLVPKVIPALREFKGQREIRDQ